MVRCDTLSRCPSAEKGGGGALKLHNPVEGDWARECIALNNIYISFMHQSIPAEVRYNY